LVVREGNRRYEQCPNIATSLALSSVVPQNQGPASLPSGFIMLVFVGSNRQLYSSLFAGKMPNDERITSQDARQNRPYCRPALGRQPRGRARWRQCFDSKLRKPWTISTEKSSNEPMRTRWGPTMTLRGRR